MADPSARWHGDNYQSRQFWIHAASLIDEHRTDVAEVTFEAHGPKAFDDVVVRYEPGRPNRRSPEPVIQDHYQIKWHTDLSGHFGFRDLIDPKFISGTAVSLLERLRDAKRTAPPNSAFHFVTTHDLTQEDPLRELVSNVDHSIRLKVLKEGKTPRSRMGEVREVWCEHLKVTEEELFEILTGFHIETRARSLETLRSDVAMRFRSVGLNGHEADTIFPYDEFARELVVKQIRSLDRAAFKALCEREGWYLQKRAPSKRGVAIQTYAPRATPADLLLAAPENTLVLADNFDDRQLKKEHSWDQIRDDVKAFLSKKLQETTDFRLFLDAPSSLGFLAGACLGLKSGAAVELVQMGHGNPNQVWDTSDGRGGPAPSIEVLRIGDGQDIALVMSLTRNALPKVQEYLHRALPQVGTVVHVTPSGGAAQVSVAGGEHALSIAAFAGQAVSDLAQPGGRTHVFISAPNAVSFFLGQQADSMGVCIPYEFDLKKEVDASYRPSFEIDPRRP
ncbi:SAVED domain-containing protein [Pseudogemmobacter faecipullorum]|uniref:SAVED domain-containing protein n=1 Tax=Pseudogemmobacter faecipullorum TaxID=2755041 RepID=A0ABS8CPB1_9RHOB|nr:SAVED domain-containing protein [Pseudogemmobacter faecipullorum]MCB5411226.1 SAVED domain-containing protein [Pseudogemmobacter faecipullorum]